MAQFMFLLGGVDKDVSFKNRDVTMAKYEAWTQALVQSGVLRDAHKLTDGEGRRIEMRKGTVTDGPFVETKETIGGYYVVEASDYQAAVVLASECPVLQYQHGFVEVRQIEF